MKKIVNGEVFEMTAEEIAEQERHQIEVEKQPQTVEEQIAELREAIDLLLSGVTE